jgi:hypothetical protein
MDHVLSPATVLKHEIERYLVHSFNARLLYSENLATGLYTIAAVPNDWHKRPHIMLMAELVNDKVVILVDSTDRPLHKALVDAGLPREHIRLAYQGE